MTGSALTHVGDPAESRSRAQSVALGARLTIVTALAGVAYALATWGGANRTVIVALFAAAAVVGVLALGIGPARILQSRHGDHLMLAWAVATVGLVGSVAAADGGARSPLAALFFLPLAFVALSFELRSVVAIAAADVITFVAVGVAGGAASQAYLAFYATCLAITALMCAWEARNNDRRQADLERVSRADPLTGCLNRRGFEERVDAELDAGMRTGRRAGLVLLDLDNFKAVNDTHGHAAGDELLRWTVARATSVLRPMDSLGRLGGDEFAILVPGAATADAREVAQRVSDALRERVSLSTGVASFPADGTGRDGLFRHADDDLYSAKQERAGAPTGKELTWAAAIARAVDLRTAAADEHSAAVARYAAAIAQRLGWSGTDLALLRMAAVLHDVGKVAVPDTILSKAGPLTVDEYDRIKTHPATGAAIVEQIDGLSPIVEWIRHSHEHVDGSGYPAGLRGDEIPLASRILLVADAFDAMTSFRPYEPVLPPDAALEELRTGTGRQFDRGCVEELEAHLAESGLAGQPAGAASASAA